MKKVKIGRLNNTEKEYILKYKSTKSVQEICKKLSRSEQAINNFILKTNKEEEEKKQKLEQEQELEKKKNVIPLHERFDITKNAVVMTPKEASIRVKSKGKREAPWIFRQPK